MTGRSEIVAVLTSWADGRATPAELHAAFESASLYVQRVPGRDGGPAVAALGPLGAGFVPMFTSLDALAAAVSECDWASAPGRDLLSLVPAGYGVALDPGSSHAALLPADAIRRGVVISRAAS